MDREFTSDMPPVQFRLAQCGYFLEQYVAHSGPPDDSHFHMVTYLDAFAFSISTLDALVSPTARRKLERSPAIALVVALRNMTVHHSVVGAALSAGKFPRPLSRQLSIDMSGQSVKPARFSIQLDLLLELLDKIKEEKEYAKHTVARRYIAQLKMAGTHVFLDEVMRKALTRAREIAASA